MKPKYKSYEFGDLTFKCYFRPVGHGYECGVLCGNKPLFVGNFVYKAEATFWYKKMCSETAYFSKKYYYSEGSSAFYKKFFNSYMYKSYYTFLDHKFDKYTYKFEKEYAKYDKHYRAFAA